MTPLTTDDLTTLGVTRHQLRALLAEEVLRRVFTGCYLRTDVDDTTELRAACAARVLPDHAVVSDRSAAWIWGVSDYQLDELASNPMLEVVSIGGARATRNGLMYGASRSLLPEDVVLVGGVAVTTPLRTACDLATLRGRNRALAVLDAFRRHHGLTDADFLRVMPRFAGRRGVIQLRELWPISDARAESMAESWTRMTAYDEGFRDLVPNVWFDVPGFGLVRLDLADLRRMIAVEYDGEEFHTSPEDRARDEARRAALRRAGWIVIVVRKDGFTGEARRTWIKELRAAYAERADVPAKRVYSRGQTPFVPRRRSAR